MKGEQVKPQNYTRNAVMHLINTFQVHIFFRGTDKAKQSSVLCVNTEE